MLKLDMKKISDRIVATIPTDEVLKNTKPFEWSDEVVSGQKKAVISKAVIEENNPCVKLGDIILIDKYKHGTNCKVIEDN